MRLLLSIIMFFSVVSVFAQTEESNKYFNQGMELYNQGKYTEAIPCFEKSDSIDKRTLDSTSNRSDYSVMWLASCYYHLAEFDKAKEIDSTNSFVFPIDRNKTVLSDKYSLEGNELVEKNKIEKALECYYKCANLEKENLGEKSVSYANTLLDIYLCKENNNLNEGLDTLYYKISNIYKTRLGQYSHPYWLINVVDAYRLLWNRSLTDSSSIKNTLSKFIESYKIACKIRKNHSDISDVLCGRLSYVIAYLYSKLAESSERTNERKLYASLASSYHYYSKIAGKELEDYKKVMPIKYNFDSSFCYEVLSGKQNVNFDLYKHLLEYSLIDLNFSAIALVVDNLSKVVPDSIIYAYAMEKLGNKDYIDAAQLVDICRRSSFDKTESIESDFYSTSYALLQYMVIGETYHVQNICMNVDSFKKQKDYDTNYDLEKNSLAWHEAQFGKNSSYYTKRLLRQSAKELFENGNFDKAIACAQECLNICYDMPYADSLYIALAYKSIGVCYTYMGKEYIEKAELALKKSFDIFYRNLKYNRFTLPRLEAMECENSFVNDSKSFYLRDEYDGAKVEDFLNLTIFLNTIYKSTGNIKALAYTTQHAINILEKPSYNDKMDYPELYQDMCVVCYCDIRQIYTDKYLPEFDSIAMNNVIKYFRNQPAKQRNKYYLKNSTKRYFSSYLDMYYKVDSPNIYYQYWFENNLLTLCYEKPSNVTIGEAYNAALFSKGILLNTEIEMRKLIAESQDKTLIDKFQKLQKYYLQLENANRENKKGMNNEIEYLEAELLTKCKTYGDYTRKLSYKWQDVKSKLANGAIAIEFVTFATGKDSVLYAVIIFGKKYSAPKMIPLFEKKQLQRIEKDNYYKSNELYRLIWKPIETMLANATKVYFSPIGELYNIALENVPGVEKFQKASFYRVSTTKNIITDSNINTLNKKAIIYGGLKYDTDESTLINDAHIYNVDRNLIADDNIADSLNLRNGVVYLPATKEEALDIETKLSKSTVQTSLFTGPKGTETSIKSFSGKDIEMMHIATHGFYWTEEESNRMGELRFIRNAANSDMEDKALTRSGLLFSGANNALSGKKIPQGIDDGILTAKEISQMDLRKLDLVVLSACQTGLGEISGDGVFGLQRGFKKAGANTLMMSLWKVDDKATKLLMSRFYSNLVAGKSKIESLRDAQKYVREYETEVEVRPHNKPAISAHAKVQVQQSNTQQKIIKKVHPYKDPKYWAAFILLDALN